jgi:hypothetical protein
LRGRIRCNQCQRRLSPSSATYKGNKRIYYVCPHHPNDSLKSAYDIADAIGCVDS